MIVVLQVVPNMVRIQWIQTLYSLTHTNHRLPNMVIRQLLPLLPLLLKANWYRNLLPIIINSRYRLTTLQSLLSQVLRSPLLINLKEELPLKWLSSSSSFSSKLSRLKLERKAHTNLTNKKQVSQWMVEHPMAFLQLDHLYKHMLASIPKLMPTVTIIISIPNTTNSNGTKVDIHPATTIHQEQLLATKLTTTSTSTTTTSITTTNMVMQPNRHPLRIQSHNLRLRLQNYRLRLRIQVRIIIKILTCIKVPPLEA